MPIPPPAASDVLLSVEALRVTYGTPQQNDRFLAALRELLDVA